MDRTRVGFALLAVAAFLWIAVSLDGDGLFLAGLALVAVGASVAAFAWPANARVAGVGLLVAALGTAMFYDLAVFFGGAASVAGGVFAIGCVVAAVALFRGDARQRLVGAVVGALGAAGWVYTDGVAGGVAWQPGNVLAIVAWTFVALDAGLDR